MRKFCWNLRQLDKRTGVGCSFLLQGDLLNPGIEPGSPTLQANALPSKLPGKPLVTAITSPKFPSSELADPRGQARGGHQGAVREHTCSPAALASALP